MHICEDAVKRLKTVGFTRKPLCTSRNEVATLRHPASSSSLLSLYLFLHSFSFCQTSLLTFLAVFLLCHCAGLSFLSFHRCLSLPRFLFINCVVNCYHVRVSTHPDPQTTSRGVGACSVHLFLSAYTLPAGADRPAWTSCRGRFRRGYAKRTNSSLGSRGGEVGETVEQ